MDYSTYQDLNIRRLEPGILEIVMGDEGGKLSTATARLHAELAQVWLDVDRDPGTRVAILRGAGKGFSAGGDLAMIEQVTNDFATRARVWREARDLVYNLINCSKMVVSAMHGPAVGAGLVAGVLADVSIAGGDGRVIHGHTRRGVAAGAQTALRWTKWSLNNWLRLAGPSFDASLALEMLGFTGPDAREGVASLREKRKPSFPTEPQGF